MLALSEMRRAVVAKAKIRDDYRDRLAAAAAGVARFAGPGPLLMVFMRSGDHYRYQASKKL